jgi:hypothetical protein
MPERRQSDLLEVVGALGAAGRLTGRLDGRNEQRHENGDDRHHDQQFHQRKTMSGAARPAGPLTWTMRRHYD